MTQMAKKSIPIADTVVKFHDWAKQQESEAQQGKLARAPFEIAYDDIHEACEDDDGLDYLAVWRGNKDAFNEARSNYFQAKKDLHAVLDAILRDKQLLHPEDVDWIFDENDACDGLVIGVLKEPKRRGRQKKVIERKAIKAPKKPNFSELDLSKKKEKKEENVARP
jgi:hypothetical protein